MQPSKRPFEPRTPQQPRLFRYDRNLLAVACYLEHLPVRLRRIGLDHRAPAVPAWLPDRGARQVTAIALSPQ